MLVYDQFEGDDTTLALRQQGVQAAAVSALLAGCERHYRHACAIARVFADRWPEDEGRLDARLLHGPHDVLAAVWRWHIAPPHPRLAFDGPPRAYDMTDWLHWLRSEVDEWHAEPDLMLAMVEIVADADDAAPARLAAALRMRHAGVPWHRVGEP